LKTKTDTAREEWWEAQTFPRIAIVVKRKGNSQVAYFEELAIRAVKLLAKAQQLDATGLEFDTSNIGYWLLGKHQE